LEALPFRPAYRVFERTLALDLENGIDNGSREENASKQRPEADLDFVRTGIGF
jgi:hypothetical protein